MSITAFAQEDTSRAQAHVFFAPGLSSSGGSSFTHFGGGGEALIKRFGVGGEIGYMSPWGSFSDGVGVFSPNASFYMPTGKLSPFVTGGYTLFFRNGTANGFNYGGGINYWFKERTALRFEVRDNVVSREHLVGFRVGLTFR
jgi:hypothetical protein